MKFIITLLLSVFTVTLTYSQRKPYQYKSPQPIGTETMGNALTQLQNRYDNQKKAEAYQNAVNEHNSIVRANNKWINYYNDVIRHEAPTVISNGWHNVVVLGNNEYPVKRRLHVTNGKIDRYIDGEGYDRAISLTYQSKRGKHIVYIEPYTDTELTVYFLDY